MNEEFGARLRQERERRKISLDSIAATTKVNAALYEGLERGDVSRWPSGIFRRSFVRAYASAIGLDPDAIVREFVGLFPEPEPQPLETAAPEPKREATPEVHAGLRLKVADTAWSFAGGCVLSALQGRWAAVSVDAAVIVVTGALLFLFVGAFWMPMAIFTFGYYWGSILVVGNTPGVYLAAQAWDGRVQRSGTDEAHQVTS